MKRFHVHLNVPELAPSIAFYSRLFGAAPARQEADYAKWMLEDPPVNFAISTRGAGAGLDHFGIQADSPEALADLKARAEAADLAPVDEGATTCCYARSDKHWITDPQGIAWEHFHTLGSIPVFRETGAGAEAGAGVADAGACCAPRTPAPDAAAPASACCAPTPRPRGRPLGIPVASAPSSSCC